jgi:hypothetical protein
VFYCLQIGEDELQQQDKLQEALQKINIATSTATEAAKPATAFLVEIYVNSREKGDLHRMNVGAEMAADFVVSECVSKKNLSGSSRWRLFEVKDDGDSERLIHSSEKVLNVYVGFSGNDYLCLKDNYILKKIAETSGDCATSAGILNFKDVKGGKYKQSRTWKKHYCVFRDGCLIISRDSKQSVKGSEASRCLLADCLLYIGMDQKKLSPPTRYHTHT